MLTVRQFYQMAQQCLTLEVIVCGVYFPFSSLPESILNDWIQYLSNDSHWFDDFVFPKFDNFPSPI